MIKQLGEDPKDQNLRQRNVVHNTGYRRSDQIADTLDEKYQAVGTREILEVHDLDKDCGRERKRTGKRDAKDDREGGNCIEVSATDRYQTDGASTNCTRDGE